MEVSCAAALLTLALLAAAHLMWWFGGEYFPNRSVCAYVHRHMSSWRDEAQRLVAAVPQVLSVSGFFATLLWPLLVAMNMLLLAQVLSTVVDGDAVLAIPYVGSYSVNALSMAGLFALLQAALAVFFDRQSSRIGKTAIGLGLLLTLMVECALSLYRAWLIVGGTLPKTGNPADEVIAKAGILFTACFGFLIPMGECMLGAVAYGRFLEPGLLYLTRLVRGITIYVACAIAWALFGFHSVTPTGSNGWLVILNKSTRRIRESTTDVEDQATSAADCAKGLSSLSRGISKTRSLADLRSQSTGMVAQVAEIRRTWPSTLNDLTAQFLRVRDLVRLSPVERQVLAASGTVSVAAQSVFDGVRQTRAELKLYSGLPGRVESCRRNVDSANQQVNELAQSAKEIDDAVEGLTKHTDDLKAALNGRTAPYGVLSDSHARQIQFLVSSAGSDPDPYERGVAKITVDALAAALAEADEAVRAGHIAATKARHAASEFEKVIAGVQLPEPINPASISHLDAELVSTEREMHALLDGQEHDLDLLVKGLVQKRHVLEGRPRWVWILTHLLGPYDPSVGIFGDGELETYPALRHGRNIGDLPAGDHPETPELTDEIQEVSQ